MFVRKSKYEDALYTIQFQEKQIEILAKQLKEARRRDRAGRFISAEEAKGWSEYTGFTRQ